MSTTTPGALRRTASTATEETFTARCRSRLASGTCAPQGGGGRHLGRLLVAVTGAPRIDGEQHEQRGQDQRPLAHEEAEVGEGRERGGVDGEEDEAVEEEG